MVGQSPFPEQDVSTNYNLFFISSYPTSFAISTDWWRNMLKDYATVEDTRMVQSMVQYCYSFLTYIFSTTPTTCSNKWQRRSEWSSILQNFKNMIYYIQADRNNNDTETRCLVYIQGPILLIAHKRPISLTVLTLYLTRYVCLICWKRVKGTINPVIVCSLM